MIEWRFCVKCMRDDELCSFSCAMSESTGTENRKKCWTFFESHPKWFTMLPSDHSSAKKRQPTSIERFWVNWVKWKLHQSNSSTRRRATIMWNARNNGVKHFIKSRAGTTTTTHSIRVGREHRTEKLIDNFRWTRFMSAHDILDFRNVVSSIHMCTVKHTRHCANDDIFISEKWISSLASELLERERWLCEPADLSGSSWVRWLTNYCVCFLVDVSIPSDDKRVIVVKQFYSH